MGISRGIVNANNVQKISDFVYPLATLTNTIVIIHVLTTPIMTGLFAGHWTWACIFTFVSVLLVCGVNSYAEQLEMPFGDDEGDVPLENLQMHMNNKLLTLIEDRAQNPPTFNPKT